MSFQQSQPPRERSRPVDLGFATIVAILIIGGIALLINHYAGTLLAGTAQASHSATNTPVKATVIVTVVPTATSSAIEADCSKFIQNPTTQVPFSLPLPSGSLVGQGKSALGTGITPVCTPNATKSSIDSFMTSNLSATGWRRYNASTDSNNGCGASFNWIKNNTVAITWDYGAFTQSGQDFGPPGWEILQCTHLSNG